MADLYLKKLESERKQLWASCRLKGLPKGTPERLRIDALDELRAEFGIAEPHHYRAAHTAWRAAGIDPYELLPPVAKAA